MKPEAKVTVTAHKEVCCTNVALGSDSHLDRLKKNNSIGLSCGKGAVPSPKVHQLRSFRKNSTKAGLRTSGAMP